MFHLVISLLVLSSVGLFEFRHRITHGWIRLSNTHFLYKAHHSLFLCSGTLVSTSARRLRGHFKQWNLQRKNTKIQKNAALSRSWEGHRKAEHRLVWPQLGTYMAGDSKFCRSVHFHEWPRRGPRVVILGLQILFSELANSQIQNPRITGIGCAVVFTCSGWFQSKFALILKVMS